MSFKQAAAVTPHDVDELPRVSAGLYIGSAGNLRVLMAAENDDLEAVTFNAVPAGTTLHIKVRKVFATGTVASNILALYS